MDTQEGHSTALLGAETMDRRGVWVRKPMFEPDWEDTSAWAAYRGEGFTAALVIFEQLRAIFSIGCMLGAEVALCGVDTDVAAPILAEHVPFVTYRSHGDAASAL